MAHVRTAKPDPEGLDKNAKIKIAVASVVMLVALVLIANQMGWITLWGGPVSAESVTAPKTPEEKQKQQVLKQQAQQEAEVQARRPGTIKAGE